MMLYDCYGLCCCVCCVHVMLNVCVCLFGSYCVVLHDLFFSFVVHCVVLYDVCVCACFVVVYVCECVCVCSLRSIA